ncbi:MAG: hypothetical protein ACOCRK_06720 [bacterium]
MIPYFVATNERVENAAIIANKPNNLLISYYYWKRKFLNKFINKIGYKPNILLDSGAYSAEKKDKKLSVLNYIKYIKEHDDLINEYVSFDVIGDAELSYKFYKIMKYKNLNPIPVYHYKANEKYLKKYIKDGNKLIALGNTVPVGNKKGVADWINYLYKKYDVDFHLLGSSSKKIINNCPQLRSFDSSSYLMMAINGYPKNIKTKTQRAIINMQKTIELCS